MGMAASQARFLGLTARKSNVEYQVQQINQQRTSLANESAGLYNQMMELSVPTPPSVNSFVSTKYVLEGSGDEYATQDYRISNMTKTYEAQGQYLVTLSTKKDDVKTKLNTYSYMSKSVSTAEDGTTTSTISLQKKDTTSTVKLAYIQDKDGNIPSAYEKEGTNDVLKVAVNQIYAIDTTKENQPDGYEECHNTTDGQNIAYFYQDKAGKNHFLTADDLNRLLNNKEGNEDDAFSFMSTYTYSQEMTTQVKAFLETSSNNRMTSITIEENDAYGNLSGMTFSLSAVQETDEAGYEQAMNDYEYEKAMYEKAISDINSKTETVQAKDQSLELKIQQLDTEQNAIATEMESVTKIIDDNVQKTFNVFG